MNTMKMNLSQQCPACAVAFARRPDGAAAARRADVRVWLAVAALGVLASIVLAWQPAPMATMSPETVLATAVAADAVRPSQPVKLLDCPVPTFEGMSCPVPDLPSP